MPAPSFLSEEKEQQRISLLSFLVSWRLDVDRDGQAGPPCRANILYQRATQMLYQVTAQFSGAGLYRGVVTLAEIGRDSTTLWKMNVYRQNDEKPERVVYFSLTQHPFQLIRKGSRTMAVPLEACAETDAKMPKCWCRDATFAVSDARDPQKVDQLQVLVATHHCILMHLPQSLVDVCLSYCLPFVPKLSSILLQDTPLTENSLDLLAREWTIPSLTDVNLSGTSPSAAGLRRLMHHMRSSTVAALNLNQCGFFDAVVEGLPHLPNLTRLELEYCLLSDTDVAHLSDVLPSTRIQTLGLKANYITERGAQSLADNLTGSQLVNLYLEKNRIGPAGFLALVRVLPQSRLRTLGCGENNIGAEELAVSELVVSLKDPRCRLQELGLSYNRLGPAGGQKLGGVLAEAKTKLLALNLDHNNLGAEGVSALASAFPCLRLEMLSLCHNGMGSRGAAALAKAFQQCPSLREVYLDGNQMGDTGCELIAESLCESKVNTLGLSRNVIHCRGAEALVRFLPRWTQLRVLALERNAIGDQGGTALASCLPNTNLEELYLQSNLLDINTTTEMTRVVPHTQLRCLFMSSYSLRSIDPSWRPLRHACAAASIARDF